MALKFDFTSMFLLYMFLDTLAFCGSENLIANQKTPRLHRRRAFRNQHCSPQFSHIKNHSACLPPSPFLIRHGLSASDRTVILKEHNKFRGMVQPTASNMLKLTWDDEIEMIAQAWADNCHIGHDLGEHRIIPGKLSLGQNFGEDYPDWPSCIKAWYDENKKFVYNGTTELHDVGHYTQLVWAETAKIGCGFAVCNTSTGRHTFQVCNYGPQGNLGGHRIPYKRGPTCAECPDNCIKGLCDCHNKVCFNGATINRSTCKCSCTQPFHVGDTCKLNCGLAKTLEVSTSYCGREPFDKKGCTIYGNEPDACPVLCGVCPYGDLNFTDVSVTFPPSTRATPQYPDTVSHSTHARSMLIVLICCAAVTASVIELDKLVI